MIEIFQYRLTNNNIFVSISDGTLKLTHSQEGITSPINVYIVDILFEDLVNQLIAFVMLLPAVPNIKINDLPVYDSHCTVLKILKIINKLNNRITNHIKEILVCELHQFICKWITHEIRIIEALDNSVFYFKSLLELIRVFHILYFHLNNN